MIPRKLACSSNRVGSVDWAAGGGGGGDGGGDAEGVTVGVDPPPPSHAVMKSSAKREIDRFLDFIGMDLTFSQLH